MEETTEIYFNRIFREEDFSPYTVLAGYDWGDYWFFCSKVINNSSDKRGFWERLFSSTPWWIFHIAAEVHLGSKKIYIYGRHHKGLADRLDKLFQPQLPQIKSVLCSEKEKIKSSYEKDISYKIVKGPNETK